MLPSPVLFHLVSALLISSRSLSVGLRNGGFAGLFWVFVGTVICYSSVVASLAEMESMLSRPFTDVPCILLNALCHGGKQLPTFSIVSNDMPVLTI